MKVIKFVVYAFLSFIGIGILGIFATAAAKSADNIRDYPSLTGSCVAYIVDSRVDKGDDSTWYVHTFMFTVDDVNYYTEGSPRLKPLSSANPYVMRYDVFDPNTCRLEIDHISDWSMLIVSGSFVLLAVWIAVALGIDKLRKWAKHSRRRTH